MCSHWAYSSHGRLGGWTWITARTCCKDYISHLIWECHGILWEWLEAAQNPRHRDSRYIWVWDSAYNISKWTWVLICASAAVTLRVFSHRYFTWLLCFICLFHLPAMFLLSSVFIGKHAWITCSYYEITVCGQKTKSVFLINYNFFLTVYQHTANIFRQYRWAISQEKNYKQRQH